MTFLSSRRTPLLAAALFAAFTVAVLLLRPPLPIDETRYLTVAWEMWRDGTPIVPHLNGETYSHKPPLLFWLMNLVWSVAGVTEFGARLVAPAFGLAAVGLTWRLGRRLWPESPERAGLAALILASGGVYLFYGSATMFDTLLAVAVLLAMEGLLSLRRTGGWRPVALLGGAIALGVYAKGPVVLIHVLPVAALMPVWADPATRPPLGRWLRDVVLAVAVALLLVALWLGPALVLGGADYRSDVLWRQNAGRMVAAFAHERPFWFYLSYLPLFLWPWGWSRQALGALSPRRLWGDEASRFVAIWGGATFLAFSLISSKQSHYLIPELPAMALLLSGMALPQEGMRWVRLLALAPAALVLGIIVAAALDLMPDMVRTGGTVSWGSVAAAVAIFLALLAFVLRSRQTWPALVAVAPATLLMFLTAASPLLFAGYDAAPIGRILAENEGRGIATADKGYAGQFNFAGRLNKPVANPDSLEALAEWAETHPGGLVVTREDISSVPLDLIGRRWFGSQDYKLYRVPERPL